MKWFSTVLLVALVLSVLVVVGCAQQPAPSPATSPATSQTAVPTAGLTTAPAAKAQNLVIGMSISPRLLDPDDLASMSIPIYDMMYNKLVRWQDGKLVPDLAESWEVTNPTTWRFRLRKGVKFHNGEDFNAEAVKFTVEWDMKPENNRLSRLGGVQDVERVNVIDDYTVDLVTKAPAGTLAAFLTRVYMLPPKHYARVGAQDFNNAPVGTGPFKYVSWKRDEFIRLEANPDYWEGRPKLDKIEIRVIPEPSSRGAALKAGEVHLIYQTFPEQIDELKKAGFTVTPVTVGQTYLYGFGRETQRIKPLQDKRVRQAIQYAIDKDAIVTGITGGLARKSEDQLGSPSAFGHNPDVKAYPYDPEKAKQLLAEAGYAQGFTVPLKSTSGRAFKDRETTQAIVSYLSKVGIKSEVEFLEPAVWAERFLNNKLDEGGIWTADLTVLPPMDVVISYNQFVCDMPRKFWCNAQYDDLFKKQNAELDPAKRLEFLKQMAVVLREESPIMFLYHVPFIYSYASNVRDVVFYENGSINLTKTTIQ
ncbi:Periplasmic dipeptide transport protein [Anaerolineae bacterium]|nr:Periplasmic dipeptide transport protein [Anaerolineae bacterium]